jgi:RNA polymerase sigma-54 factor
MATFLGTAHRIETSLRVDPRLIVSARVMELSAVELDAAIDAEIAENPALERSERVEPVINLYRAETEDRESQRSRPQDDALPDLAERVTATAWTRDSVLVALMSRLAPERRSLGEFLVGMLDGRGYLKESDEEIALATGATLEEVAEAIEVLQSCDPAGVGARGVRDGLSIMLRREGTPEARLAEQMLSESLEDLVARRTARLARRFKVSEEEVEEAYAALLAQNPSPFGDEGLPPAPAAEADLALVRTESGWTVEVAGPDPAEVHPSRQYLRHRRRLTNDANADAGERKHVDLHLDRAHRFISALESRRNTLRRLGEALLRSQAGFITTGDVRFIRPLTRAALAEEIGVHESTLSRATANKFVRIGTGEVVPFATFFTPSLRVQSMIEEIVAMENPTSPLSDERIRQMLAERGVNVARRTVNKYRTRGRTLSSRERRDAKC